MKGTFLNNDMVRLTREYLMTLKEANLLIVINKKLAKQRLERAHCVALQIAALRFMN